MVRITGANTFPTLLRNEMFLLLLQPPPLPLLLYSNTMSDSLISWGMYGNASILLEGSAIGVTALSFLC